MSWIGLLIIIVCVWLALKVAGVLLKVLLWALVLFGVYWLLAPLLGLPFLF
jgi:hypothetical protein